MSFRAVAVRGAVAIGAAQAVKLAIQLAIVVIFARAIGPREFGIYAMLSPILALAVILRDGGTNSAILQRETVSDDELSTLFWLNAGLATVLAAAMSVAAPLFSAFYGEPRLTALIIASSAIIVMGAIPLQHLALLNRQYRFTTLALIDCGSLAAGFAAGLIAAQFTRSYWALWTINVVTTGVRLLASWLLCGWRPGRPRHPGPVIDLLYVSGNLTVSALLDFVVRCLDKILIGRVLGSVALGLYDRAYRIVMLPIVFVSAPLDRLVLPALVRVRADATAYRRAYQLALQAPLLALAPAVGVLMACPRAACLLILGRQWLAATPLIPWLAFVCLLQLMTGSLTSLLVSQGRPRTLTAINALTAALAAVAFLVGIRYGSEGVAAGYAVCEAIRLPLVVWLATRTGPVSFGAVARTAMPFLVATAATAMFALALTSALSAPAALLAAGLAVGYAVTLPCMLLSRAGRDCLGEIRQLGSGLRGPLGSVIRSPARP